MKLSPLFKLREQATPELLRLLNSVTLGTNGAKYKHLNTDERILEADNPLHLSLERNEKILGNITFCRREEDWYIRYFAFDQGIQSGGVKKSRGKSGFLKKELDAFFNQMLHGDSLGKVDSFYAYIDPKNEKSLWMSENFGFEAKASIATQTFSRTKLKPKTSVTKALYWTEVAPIFRENFGDHNYYFEAQLAKGPFYGIKNASGEIIALAKTTNATWKIERLPGKLGGFLTKIIPYIPSLRKIVRPNNHQFVVPEAVFIKNNHPELLQELFEGILYHEKRNLILWWVDETNSLYTAVSEKLKWGLLHKIIGVHQVSLVIRNSEENEYDNSKPVYTSGFDFV